MTDVGGPFPNDSAVTPRDPAAPNDRVADVPAHAWAAIADPLAAVVQQPPMTPGRRRELQQVAFGAGVPTAEADAAARQLADADAVADVDADAEVKRKPHVEEAQPRTAHPTQEASAPDSSGAVTAIVTGAAVLSAARYTVARPAWVRPPFALTRRGSVLLAASVLVVCVAGVAGYVTATVASGDRGAGTSVPAAPSAAAPSPTDPSASAEVGPNVTAARAWFGDVQQPEDVYADLMSSVDTASTRHAGGAGSITDVWIAKSNSGGLCLGATFAIRADELGSSGESQCIVAETFEQFGITVNNGGDAVKWDGVSITFSAGASK